MSERETDLGPLYETIAERFRALGTMFASLDSPGAVRDLLDTLMSEDPAPFNEFADQFKLPVLGKCFWVREVIERVISDGHFVMVCRVRADLTAQERLLYLQIAMRHHMLTPLAKASPRFLASDGSQGIPPGPFLDELIANGLTVCEAVWVDESYVVPALAAPERVCV